LYFDDEKIPKTVSNWNVKILSVCYIQFVPHCYFWRPGEQKQTTFGWNCGEEILGRIRAWFNEEKLHYLNAELGTCYFFSLRLILLCDIYSMSIYSIVWNRGKFSTISVWIVSLLRWRIIERDVFQDAMELCIRAINTL
jgi:hypothetical protein